MNIIKRWFGKKEKCDDGCKLDHLLADLRGIDEAERELNGLKREYVQVLNTIVLLNIKSVVLNNTIHLKETILERMIKDGPQIDNYKDYSLWDNY